MRLFNEIRSGFSILWELGLGLLSFIFFKTVKFIIRRLLSVYYLVAKKQAYQWKVASAELLKKPGVLPMIMTMGPRLNTHAIIGNVGPLALKRSLTVHVAAAERSAQVWTLVVTTFPSNQTVTSISSLDAPFPTPTAEIPLRPGKYWIALRYFRWAESVELPALAVDGVEVIPSTPVPSDLDGFYRTCLAGKSNPFYLCLNYYVFVLLRYRRFFPAAFVEREFLPMPNPETRFHFGALQAGECLSIQLDPSLLTSYDVYLTIYNRASFPMVWLQVIHGDFVTAECTADGFYLVRVHNKGPLRQDFPKEGLRISVIGRAGQPLERHGN